MTDLTTKYPAGTRVRLTAAVEGALAGGTGLTGTVTAWNVPANDRGDYVRVILDKDKTTILQSYVVQVIEAQTGEPGLLFAEEELAVR